MPDQPPGRGPGWILAGVGAGTRGRVDSGELSDRPGGGLVDHVHRLIVTTGGATTGAGGRAVSSPELLGCSLRWVPHPDDLRERVAAIPWYHSIDLGGGLVTPGNPPDERMLAEGLPPVEGKSVLDIGAWDGFWSIEAERRGARRVVAMDHYAWSVDFGRRLEYWERCEKDGVVPDHTRDFTEFWEPETLPGRAGFELAHDVLGSTVEPVAADFMTADPDEIGRFDVVLFLGVLYHVREPLTALERVRGLTGRVAVIETEAIAVLGMPGARFLEFHESAGLRGDYTNWFVPTEHALHSMCKAAGFGRVETRIGPPRTVRQLKTTARRTAERLGDGAIPTGPLRRRRDLDASHPASTRYRIAVHAFVD